MGPVSAGKSLLAALLGIAPVAIGFYTNNVLRDKGWKAGSAAVMTTGALIGSGVLAYITTAALIPSEVAPEAPNGSVSGVYLPAGGGLPRSLDTGGSLGLINATRSVMGLYSTPASVRKAW